MQNITISNTIGDMNSQFNKELLELLCSEKNEIIEENHDICLISNTKLIDPIKLACGHTFNYDSIFNEIKGQSYYNGYETQILKKWQIKCPYCRTIQNGILPYRNNYKKITGVNWPTRHQHMPNKCTYIFSSGKRKNMTCNKNCLNKYCTGHQNIMNKRNAKKEQALNIPTCQYKFKKGNKKGSFCKCKTFFNNSTHCKTHYKHI